MNKRTKLQRAVELYQAGDVKQAESVCREIVKNQPDNADALHFLGSSLIRPAIMMLR